MSRILRHVGNKDFKRTRQRQIGEQKERAAQKLKEWQEAEAERKQIEEIARPFKSDWREETQLQENDWTPVAGSIANSSAQTFHYRSPNFETGEPNAFTVSGLGGVESVPSTTTIDSGFGETENVSGPNYSQLGLQGYAPPLGGVQRQTQQSENERIDAEIRKLEEQIKESKAKETAAIDAWNAELIATMDRHQREWDAVLKKDEVYNPEKHKGLQARHGAEMDAIWNKEPKTEPYETERQNLRAKIFELEKQRPINQQLDASQQAYPNLPMMGARVQPVNLPRLNVLGDRNLSIQPTNPVYDTLAKIGGVETAKNFVDHYIDNFVLGDQKQDQNLTKLLTKDDRQYLEKELPIKDMQNNFTKILRGKIDSQTKINQINAAVRQVLEDGPEGIQNSLGRGVTLDIEYFKKTGDFKLDKTYQFTSKKDLGYRSGGNLMSNFKSLFTKGYTSGKMPGGDVSPLIQNPMRFHVIIRGPKRKKKEEEELGESTWSRLKKYR